MILVSLTREKLNCALHMACDFKDLATDLSQQIALVLSPLPTEDANANNHSIAPPGLDEEQSRTEASLNPATSQ